MRIKNEDRDANALKITSIWLAREGQWLSPSTIKNEAAHMGFKDKTVSRYLNWLVTKKKLEIKEESIRKRFFRPTDEYWEKNFKWIPITPTANDSEFLFFTGLASEITEKFDKTCQQLVKEDGKPKPIGKGLNRTDLNELNALIGKMVRSLRLDLSREYFSEGMEPQAVYALLRENVKRAVMA